jgi:hypothetical protein
VCPWNYRAPTSPGHFLASGIAYDSTRNNTRILKNNTRNNYRYHAIWTRSKGTKKSGITYTASLDAAESGTPAGVHESSLDTAGNRKIETLLADIVTRLDRIEEKIDETVYPPESAIKPEFVRSVKKARADIKKRQREDLHANSVISIRSWKNDIIGGTYRREMAQQFNDVVYPGRQLVENKFSVLKRKFDGDLKARIFRIQTKEITNKMIVCTIHRFLLFLRVKVFYEHK